MIFQGNRLTPKMSQAIHVSRIGTMTNRSRNIGMKIITRSLSLWPRTITRAAPMAATILLAAAVWCGQAQAQPRQVVTTCGTQTLVVGDGNNGYIDATGLQCGKATATLSGALPAGTNNIGLVDPTGTTAVAPVVSGSLENAHVLKNAAGRLYSAYAANLTGGTASNLLIFNATSAPVDGAVTPIVCVPFNSNGVASANYQGLPPASFATGITAVVSSAASCFTKTTGVTTAFISGIVQ